MAFLSAGPANGRAAVLIAHGAGAPMDSPFMNAISDRLADRGLRVSRFEFSYMAARRTGTRKSPPRAERLLDEYRRAVDDLDTRLPLVIGGKSLGGRVASMVADELFAAEKIAGLACLGYPFHPPGRPDRLRTAHLKALATPTLVFQGTRDPFGTREEVAGYDLSPKIEVHWLEDGDHDLKPRKASGLRHADHLRSIAERIGDWTRALA